MLPLLVGGGLSKAELVTLHRVPPYQQQEAMVILDAAAKLMPSVTAGGSDDRLRSGEGLEERRRLTAPYVENRHFEHRVRSHRAWTVLRRPIGCPMRARVSSATACQRFPRN